MALIKCPECNREISDKALSCPHCGMPFEARDRDTDIPQKEESADYIDIKDGEKDVSANLEELVEYDEDYEASDNSTAATDYGKKKFIKIIVCAIIAIILCFDIKIAIDNSGSDPVDISSNMSSYGESTVKAVDDYIDNKIDFERAYTKIDGLKDRAEYESYLYKDSDLYKDNEQIYDKISYLCSRLYYESNGYGTYSELLGSRNSLAKLLDIDERD